MVDGAVEKALVHRVLYELALKGRRRDDRLDGEQV
jgi:hypothetical protein